MHGSSESSITKEFIDSSVCFPGNDKSCVSLFLVTKVPESLTPICSATPMGDRTNPGICGALSKGRISSQPFLISLLKASLKNDLCILADT